MPGERPSALIVSQRPCSLAARGGRRRWTNGGRASGQCLDSGAVFCLNSETVKAVCAGWRGHYQQRLLESLRGGGWRRHTAKPEVGSSPLNQMTIGSQSSNGLPPTLRPSHRMGAAAFEIHWLRLGSSPPSSLSLPQNYKSCQRDLDFAPLIELREKPIKFWRFHELSEESL